MCILTNVTPGKKKYIAYIIKYKQIRYKLKYADVKKY